MAESELNREVEAESTVGIGLGEAPRGDALPEALVAQIDALIKSNQALTRSFDSERHEKARLLSAVSRLQGENAALRETLAPAHAISDEVAQLAGMLVAQGARLDALTEHVQRLNHGPVAAAGHYEGGNQAAEQLHAILTSRSWRVMRPLRGLGRLMRRLRA